MEKVIALGIFEALTRKQKIGLGATGVGAGALVAPEAGAAFYSHHGDKAIEKVSRTLGGSEESVDRDKKWFRNATPKERETTGDITRAFTLGDRSTGENVNKAIDSYNRSDTLKDISPVRKVVKGVRRLLNNSTEN